MPHRTLLLVEDDTGVRRVLRDMLRHAGFTVREAADGASALAAVGAGLPDAIVLDMVLPGITGFEVLDRLRESGVAASVPVITMTGSVLSESEMREKGARGVLQKPFSLQQLRDALERPS